MSEDTKPPVLTHPNGVPFVPDRARKPLSPQGALSAMQVTRVNQLIAAAVAPLVAHIAALSTAVKALGGSVPDAPAKVKAPPPAAKKKVAMPKLTKGKPAPAASKPAADPSAPPPNNGRAPSADGSTPPTEYPAEIQGLLDACPAAKGDLKKALRSIADTRVPETVRVMKMKALLQNS